MWLKPQIKEKLSLSEETDWQDLVTQIYNLEDADSVIIESNSYSLQKSSFMRLKPGVWLNDEVMNAYVSLVNEVDPANTIAFNTFFYTQLDQMRQQGSYNFRKLQRIVQKKKVNLRRLKNVLIPINIKSYHWLLMNLNMLSGTFEVLDSMPTSLQSVEGQIDIVRQFLQDYFHSTKSESPCKKLEDNTALWKVSIPQITP